MIHVSGWITDVRPRNGLEEKNVFLLPVSSGYQQYGPADGADYTMERPQGRLDSQILYIQKGRGLFEIEGTAFEAVSGQVVLIPAHAPHRYTYDHRQDCTVYWVHCTGYGMPDMIDALLSGGGFCIAVGQSRHMVDLFQRITMEFQRKDAQYEGICSGMLQELLHYILRKKATLEEAAHRRRDDRIDRVVTLMHEQYMYPWTMKELADRANLCPSRFIHLFTETQHVSPGRFLGKIRMDNARELLCDDNLSIGDVSRMVGFQSLQYFCRAFRAETGMSPSEYRNQAE